MFSTGWIMNYAKTEAKKNGERIHSLQILKIVLDKQLINVKDTKVTTLIFRKINVFDPFLIWSLIFYCVSVTNWRSLPAKMSIWRRIQGQLSEGQRGWTGSRSDSTLRRERISGRPAATSGPLPRTASNCPTSERANTSECSEASLPNITTQAHKWKRDNCVTTSVSIHNLAFHHVQ